MSMAVLMAFIAAVGLCFKALSMPQAVFSYADSGMKIVLDAGHGGIDGGVTGKVTGTKESDINLAITTRLYQTLSDMGFEVTLTRKTEAGLYGAAKKGFKKRDMQRRKEIIEETDPSLVLSIHQNFYPSKRSRGAQVFYKKEDENALKFACALQEKLNALYATEGVAARNAATGDYFILKCSDCPSVIVECGFLSNAADEKLLLSEVWQKQIAQNIAEGIVAYLSDSAA